MDADPVKLDSKITNDRPACGHGHAMTPENTVYRMGIRGCRQCIRDRKKNARERFDKRTSKRE